LVLESRYTLAPLAGFTDLSFRLVVRALGGVGLATTDLVNARALLTEHRRSLELIETCPKDRPLAVQIFGTDIAVMRDAAQFLESRGIDVLDINMGCPVNRINKTGAGAQMMCRPTHAIDLVHKIVESVRLPVTVKMRLGWDETQITAPHFAREFEAAGAAAVTVHGRTRDQAFGGAVRLDEIRKVVQAVDAMPVFGNGDVRSVHDAAKMLAETGCSGVSIGRGALANPWIFSQLAQWERTGEFDPPGSLQERLDLLSRQFEILEDLRGTRLAIIFFRRIGHWYMKSMRVRAALRHRFQLATTRAELDAVLQKVAAEGPIARSALKHANTE
jgi:nifR3 family TIM-barrel protein